MSFLTNYEGDEDNVEPHSCGVLSCFMGTLCFGMGIFSCFTVSPKEEAVLLDYGKYNGTVKEPGIYLFPFFFVFFQIMLRSYTQKGVHFVCNFGRTIYKVSTKVKSIMIPETKTIDRNGNPLIINGILAYQIRNSKRASLDVEYPCPLSALSSYFLALDPNRIDLYLYMLMNLYALRVSLRWNKSLHAILMKLRIMVCLSIDKRRNTKFL